MASLEKKLAQLTKQQDRIGSKIDTLKQRHARALMNEARALLGRAPLGKQKRKGKPSPMRKAKAKGPTFSPKGATKG